MAFSSSCPPSPSGPPVLHVLKKDKPSRKHSQKEWLPTFVSECPFLLPTAFQETGAVVSCKGFQVSSQWSLPVMSVTAMDELLGETLNRKGRTPRAPVDQALTYIL